MVREFCDDDQPEAHESFQRWRADNQAGYFINCRRSGGWMLHLVTCAHAGEADWPIGEWGSLTRIRKACSTDAAELRRWALERGQIHLNECSDCEP
jgi:hypothetical protein